MDNLRVKKLKENIMYGIFMSCAIVSILCVILICVFLFVEGTKSFSQISITEILFKTKWAPNNIPSSFGILPMILGSIYVTVLALAIGTPTGIFTAIFLSKFCHKKIYRVLKTCVNLLAGIPSVVYGFFGIMVIVPFIRKYIGGNGNSILSASILLAVMILPTIINISESAISSVSQTYYEGAVALGTTHEMSVFKVVVPAASRGIVTSVILGLGRAIGETMAVIMVAGNQARMPSGILKGVRTLTANVVLEMGYASGLHREVLFTSALILLILILIINILFNLINSRGEKHE